MGVSLVLRLFFRSFYFFGDRVSYLFVLDVVFWNGEEGLVILVLCRGRRDFRIFFRGRV